MCRLKGKFIDSDGKKVDYVALKKSKEFEEYLSEVKELQKVKLDTLTEIQRKVFFISILFVIIIILLIISDAFNGCVYKCCCVYMGNSLKLGIIL